MDKRENFIMNRVQEHYNEVLSLGYEVVGVFLQGSQNYLLDCYDETYQSDIDTKAIVLPSLDDIVLGRSPVSTTYVRANNEHIDIKDVRVMFEMFKKQNNSYIELLFTDFYIINPKYRDLMKELYAIANDIAWANPNAALRALAGTSMEKYKALEHPYPNTIDKIEKFGYDPKQLHHMMRIYDLMKKFVNGLAEVQKGNKPFYGHYLVPEHHDELLEVKKGKYILEEARKLAKAYDGENKLLKDMYVSTPDIVDVETYKKLDEIKVKLIKQFLQEELLNG